jgi:LmbE family N-acetylglucosaminyl deacetylase
VLLRRLKWIARLGLNRCAAMLLTIWSRPLSLARNDPILVIAPHPDDEALGCGGLIALRRRIGAHVQVIYVSDGGASDPGLPRSELVALRRSEATEAMRMLGVDPAALMFLAARDGELDSMPAEERNRCVSTLAAAIAALKPACVFTACERDLSTDHDAVFALVRAALDAAPGARLLQYAVWSWWNPRFLPPVLFRARYRYRCDVSGIRDVKRAALACYRSQIETRSGGDDPVLPSGFLRLFTGSKEFFFEF